MEGLFSPYSLAITLCPLPDLSFILLVLSGQYSTFVNRPSDLVTMGVLVALLVFTALLKSTHCTLPTEKTKAKQAAPLSTLTTSSPLNLRLRKTSYLLSAHELSTVILTLLPCVS